MSPVPVLIGVPYDASSSFQRGPAEAPGHIRQALWSESTNTWTESLRDLRLPGMLADAGDVALTDATMLADVEKAVREELSRGLTPLVLGGDHSITLPVVRAVHRERGRFSILHFDAHPDLYPEFQGDRFSHACPFYRIMEESLATSLTQVGIRTLSGIQAESVKRWNVRQVSPEEWNRGWVPQLEGPVYLSIDLDVLDPAFAPGLSHPEPGGCTTRQLITAIQQIKVPIVGADIVELNPRNDPAGLTARVAAKLVKEVADRILK
jgi:arginase